MKFNSFMIFELAFIGIVIFLIFVFLLFLRGTKENFFFSNIKPTEDIDPDYLNPNEDRFNYFNFMRVGDIEGVDLNCNNVSKYDLIRWMVNEEPNIIYDYVYKFDPSIDINNPIDSPRILKMILRNLPQKHRFISILRKCLPKTIRVA